MSPGKWPKSRTLTVKNCWRECGTTGTLIHCWLGYKNSTATWKTVWLLFTKLNIPLLSSNPATLLLSIYPKELKAYIHTKTCTWMFIAALLIIAQTWKQPRCPSVIKWIN
jgi:hypothetical protein